jgi:hypothetical protein
MRAHAGFWRHLSFRLFQRYPQLAVTAKRCGESVQVDPVAALPGQPVRTGERQKAVVGVTGGMRHERSFGYVNP